MSSAGAEGLSLAMTAKQTEDLHKAMLSYMRGAGMDDAADAFAAKAGVKEDPAQKDALVRKWKSVLRLQKKVLELEAEVAELKDTVKNAGKAKKADDSESLPRSAPRCVLQGHKRAVTSLAFHPAYTLLVTASEDATLKLWDSESGKFERSLAGHTDAVQDAAFSPSGALLASCSNDMSVKLWDMESHACVKTLNGHDHTVSAVAFTVGGEGLVSASRDGKAKLWDVSTGYCTRTFTGHDGWVKDVAVSPDALTMATSSADETVKVWNLKTAECVRTLRGHENVVESVAFSSGKADILLRKALAARAVNGTTATVAAAAAGADAGSGTGESKSGPGESGPGGQYILSGSRDRTVRVWEAATGVCVSSIKAHDNWVTAVAFHPSGRYVLSAGDDKTVRVFDVTKEFREVRRIACAHFVSSLAWSSAPPMLAVGVVDSTAPVFDCGPLF